MTQMRSSTKRSFFSRKDITAFEFQFGAADLPPVELDRDQIKRVLINLLDNAVAAVEGGGRSSSRPVTSAPAAW